MRKVKRVSRIAEITCACIERLEPSEIFNDIMYYDPLRIVCLQERLLNRVSQNL